jgi:hypothetical protein
VISEESGVRKEEWSGFGGEWSAKCRVEWFRRGSINVEWSVIGEVGSCTAPYGAASDVVPEEAERYYQKSRAEQAERRSVTLYPLHTAVLSYFEPFIKSQ